MATINTSVFKNVKLTNKFPIRYQGDGQEFEADIEDDKEQLEKLQEIIDILVAAGYFRARIKGLSSFDKVVGGMTWCIELCNVDLDVDLLFQENSTIGQKIALTEKIVAVLPKLKCPHTIEPHQIQGMDCIHIFPVVQWLVKVSMENRQEMSSFVRSYAVNQFQKQFGSVLKDDKKVIDRLSILKIVEEIYAPQRRYKRKTAPPPDIDSRVQITLLEYGLKGQPGEIGYGTGNEEVLENKDIAQELAHYKDLNAEETENVNKHYASLHNELKDGGSKSRSESQLHALIRKKQLLTEEHSKFENLKLQLVDELKIHRSSLENTLYKQQEADENLKKIDRIRVENPDKLKSIEEMINLSESLKSREIQFKENCKTELAKLQRLLEDSRKSDTEKSTELNSQLQKEIEIQTEKIRSLKLHLAKKNRYIYSLQRILDDIPSRTELAQYQKRFIELYNQVSAKHKETKQYYTLYNTLEDTRLYMKKELSLLNSISENYPDAMRTPKGKEELITQFQNILESVHQSKRKVENKLEEEKQKKNELSSTLQTLIDYQRKYFATIRKISVEYSKYQALLSQKQTP